MRAGKIWEAGGGLTSLPRLNSLNQVPGFSFGHEVSLVYCKGQDREGERCIKINRSPGAGRSAESAIICILVTEITVLV